MSAIFNRLNNYSSDYKQWCRSVEAILNLRNTPSLPEKAGDQSLEVIDLENEDSTCVKLNKKPHINRLYELLEQARLNNYPRVKTESTLSSERVNLIAELDIEFKNAQQCADYCMHFIKLYKKNSKVVNQNDKLEDLVDFKSLSKNEEGVVEDVEMDETEANNSDDDIIFLKKVSFLTNSTNY